MSKVLENIEPEKVMYYFEKISRIPHGSGNSDGLSDYIAEFAKKKNLEFYQDSFKNIIVIKEATKGKETSKTLIIQGHLDMVAEKKPGSTHDFSKDPLKLRVEGDFISAKDTTLGGDDGIAVAYALAILDSKDIPHPKLEVVFTVDEEIGMIGAANIDLSFLEGKYVLNIDSEEEGVLTVGCAGGLKALVQIPLTRYELLGTKYTIRIHGLKGGHSGIEIDKERANSNILLGRILYELRSKTEVKLLNFYGGSQDNAIPRESTAEVVLTSQEVFYVKTLLEEQMSKLNKEFLDSDSGIKIEITENKLSTYKVISDSELDKIVFFLMNVPNGVQNMSAKIPGLVETSTNLGIVRMDENYFEAVFALRSSVKIRKEALSLRIKSLSKYLGATYTEGANYPEWDYNKDSKLLSIMIEVYKKNYGHEPKITTIHAGLECGYILEKIDGAHAVSFGPNMFNIHTTEEKISISSIERTYNYLLEILNNI